MSTHSDGSDIPNTRPDNVALRPPQMEPLSANSHRYLSEAFVGKSLGHSPSDGTVAECCRLGESCLRVIIGYCKSLGVGSANFNTKSARYCWKFPFMFMQSVRIRLNWVITAVRRR